MSRSLSSSDTVGMGGNVLLWKRRDPEIGRPGLGTYPAEERHLPRPSFKYGRSDCDPGVPTNS